MAEVMAAPQRTWAQTVTLYAKPVMLSMLVLGFASGLPLYMVFQKLSFWLRDAGIDRSTIGFFYWVTLSYTFKFLWAPVVDRLKIPVLHRLFGPRRSWMITAISGTVIGLLVISQTDPTTNLLAVAIGAILLSYSGATLDVAIDAWRIESAPTSMQASMAAAYSFGYRVAYMISGVGLMISSWASWEVSFIAMAGAMVVSGVLVLLMKEPHNENAKKELTGNFGTKVVQAVFEPFKQFFGRLGWWIIPVFALVSLYRLSDFTMGVMASPLYSDLEFDRAIVGGVQSGPGLAATMFGLFLGGVFAYRFGLMRSMMIGLAITLFTNGAYAWLAATASSDDIWKLAVAIVGDNVAGGFVTTVFIAYMSSLVDPANAATQYALLSSSYALFSKFLSGFMGVLADLVEWVNFFLITAGFTIPAIGLLILIMTRGTAAAQGRQDWNEDNGGAEKTAD